MNRLKFLLILTSLTLFSLACASGVHAGSVKGASVTIYNSGQALVKETRTVSLPKGMASVVFKDVPVTLDPSSVHAAATGMTVLDLQYTHAPITTRNLLSRYLGKELTVIMPDPGDADARVLRKAKLVANDDRPIFLVGNEVYVGAYDALLFPELPKDLQREPTLTLTTDNRSAAKRDVLLNYLMGGLNWRADYTLSVNAKGDAAALDAWATITNDSGRGFVGSSLKLVAGEVNRVRSQSRNKYAADMVMMESAMVAAAPPQPVQEEFSQYHVYSVGRLVNLAEAGTKQLSLFSAPKVTVKQKLTSSFSGGVQLRNGTIKQPVRLSLSLLNAKKNGLGRPMPGGLVRVYMPTADGTQLLAGEVGMPHVGEGGEVELNLGRAFDITVERSQTAYKKLGKNSYEMSWRIEMLNGKDTPQALTLHDRYSGEWKVVKTDRNYAVPNAGTLEFSLDIPPTKGGMPVVVNYTVHVTY